MPPLSASGAMSCAWRAACALLLACVLPRAVRGGIAEDFEQSAKAAYAVGNVTLSSGSWTLDNAVLGTSPSDAVRVSCVCERVCVCVRVCMSLPHLFPIAEKRPAVPAPARPRHGDDVV